jgi:hypothetical protein
MKKTIPVRGRAPATVTLALIAPLSLLVMAAGCGRKAPKADVTAVAEVTAASASASASASTTGSTSAKAEPPLLAFEPLVASPPPNRLFPVEGAIVVATQKQIGRLVDGKVEWRAEALESYDEVTEVQGRWPDRLDLLYRSRAGRTPELFYRPLTGPGAARAEPGRFAKGLATIGESTLLIEWSPTTEEELVTVRGKWRERTRFKQPVSDQGLPSCSVEERAQANISAYGYGVLTHAIGGLPSGTLLTLVMVCRSRGPYLEAWGGPILRYHQGTITALPRFGDATFAFCGAGGALHATDGRTVQALRDGAWTPLGRIPWPVPRVTFGVEGERLWAAIDERIYRVRTSGGPELAYGDDCKNPLVDVRAVRDGEEVGSLPETRRALATLADGAGLKLIEFYELGRRVGVVVTGRAQGEAVIAALRPTGAEPRLVCHAPKAPREVPLPASAASAK